VGVAKWPPSVGWVDVQPKPAGGGLGAMVAAPRAGALDDLWSVVRLASAQ